jgi:hypothetical protein
MIRVDTRPRRQNSGKAAIERSHLPHLQWLRGRPCVVANDECDGRMEAAHVDHAGGKGTSLKVADYKAVPACQHHHAEIHRGAKTFEAKYKIDLVAAAAAYAAKSPHRGRWADVAGAPR